MGTNTYAGRVAAALERAEAERDAAQIMADADVGGHPAAIPIEWTMLRLLLSLNREVTRAGAGLRQRDRLRLDGIAIRLSGLAERLISDDDGESLEVFADDLRLALADAVQVLRQHGRAPALIERAETMRHRLVVRTAPATAPLTAH